MTKLTFCRTFGCRVHTCAAWVNVWSLVHIITKYHTVIKQFFFFCHSHWRPEPWEKLGTSTERWEHFGRQIWTSKTCNHMRKINPMLVRESWNYYYDETNVLSYIWVQGAYMCGFFDLAERLVPCAHYNEIDHSNQAVFFGFDKFPVTVPCAHYVFGTSTEPWEHFGRQIWTSKTCNNMRKINPMLVRESWNYYDDETNVLS